MTAVKALKTILRTSYKALLHLHYHYLSVQPGRHHWMAGRVHYMMLLLDRLLIKFGGVVRDIRRIAVSINLTVVLCSMITSSDSEPVNITEI
jgi:hypothetical protein